MITIALVISALFATVGCRAAAHSDLLLDNYSMSTRSTNSVIIDSRQQDTRSLKRVFLSNRTITCNDGSQAGFFLRKSPGSLRWVVFFEGGDSCYDQKTCRSRWLRSRNLMTSAQWPEFREAGGILSNDADENPHWHDANHVLVPYCSSDSWSGRKVVPGSRDGWAFMGSLIVRQVFADLIPLGLNNGGHSSELLMAGSSAGGLGVILNLDKVRQFLQHEQKLKVLVRGVSDSGWFLDREPYNPNAITTSQMIEQGWKLWDGVVPEGCRKKYPAEPWRCYFGHRAYPTVKSPLYIFQWLFDEAQIQADSVGAPVTPQQWDYIHQLGSALRQSLQNVTAVFAPSCVGHSVLDRREWLDIKIDDISLSDALRCWEISTENQQKRFSGRRGEYRNRTMTREEKELRRQMNHERKKHQRRLQLENGESNQPLAKRKRKNNQNNNNGGKYRRLQQVRQVNVDMARDNMNGGNSSLSPAYQQDELNARRKKVNRRQKPATADEKNPSTPPRERTNEHKKQRNRSNMRRRNEITKQHHNHRHNKNQRPQQQNNHKEDPKRCALRLIQKCTWPQCNRSCPALTNPATGEEISFLSLLVSFGTNITESASNLGMDLQTLKNMDQGELLQLLTQRQEAS